MGSAGAIRVLKNAPSLVVAPVSPVLMFVDHAPRTFPEVILSRAEIRPARPPLPSHPLSDLACRSAVRRGEQDLSALDDPPLPATRASDPLELHSIRRADHDPLADHRCTSIIAHQNDNEFGFAVGGG